MSGVRLLADRLACGQYGGEEPRAAGRAQHRHPVASLRLGSAPVPEVPTFRQFPCCSVAFEKERGKAAVPTFPRCRLGGVDDLTTFRGCGKAADSENLGVPLFRQRGKGADTASSGLPKYRARGKSGVTATWQGRSFRNGGVAESKTLPRSRVSGWTRFQHFSNQGILTWSALPKAQPAVNAAVPPFRHG
jgi:hypothetical protein